MMKLLRDTSKEYMKANNLSKDYMQQMSKFSSEVSIKYYL